MTKPILVLVDDQADALAMTGNELRKRYGADYDIICDQSAEGVLQRLTALKSAEAQVAIILADLWMPEMTGVAFLERAHDLHPQAKRLVLINWGDNKAIDEVVQAMNMGWIDHFSAKPVRVLDEPFHRLVTELLEAWSRAYQPPMEVLQIVGERWSAQSHELRDILERYSVGFQFYDTDSDVGQRILNTVGKTDGPFPVVVLYNGKVLTAPSYADVADALGANDRVQGGFYDLCIIGAGPSGLSAAVYGASEGLRTIVVEREAIGGQAGTSSRIRNYLGFPTGISGGELANRAYIQAWLFGAEFYFMRQVTRLHQENGYYCLTLSDGKEFVSRSVILAMGAAYQRLGIPNLEALVGKGVFYGGAVTEALAMKGKIVFVAGAGNSAGQAAIYLARYARHVTLLARGASLTTSMSDYLINEIEATDNLEVRVNTQIIDGAGHRWLDQLVLKNMISGFTETVQANGLFILIGAKPHTDWLPESILRDDHGFILAGQDLVNAGKLPQTWTLPRNPSPLETSMPGVFAVGDVRGRSVKRVASAVGEGGIAIQMVHAYLAENKL